MALAQKDLRRLELVHLHAPVGLRGACPHAARRAEVRQLEAEAAGVVVVRRGHHGGDRGGGDVAIGGCGGGGSGACADGGGGGAAVVSLGGGWQADAGWLQISVYLPNIEVWLSWNTKTKSLSGTST